MTTEVATLAGGCFWCLEAVFEQLRGVSKVTSGYTGGHVANPTYEAVCTGTTGHAEVTQVTFDPDVVSYRDLLGVFFSLHDPTTVNRQGGDVGTQYRSAIFYHDDDRAARRLLSGRGIPPRVLPQEPQPAVLPRGHRPQGRETPDQVPAEAQNLAGS